jgi:hypothetical protein
MNLADVFTVTLVIVGFLVVYIAYWLMSAGLFPRFVERCSEQLGRSPILTTLVGGVVLVPVVAIGLAISSKAPNSAGKIAGLGIALVGMLGALFGSAGLALRIGEGLKSRRDERDPWRRVLRGGVVLGLTFVMPFLGTFVVMPLAFAAGFGAFVFCVFRRKPASDPAVEPIAVPPAVSLPPAAAVPPPMPTAS